MNLQLVNPVLPSVKRAQPWMVVDVFCSESIVEHRLGDNTGAELNQLVMNLIYALIVWLTTAAGIVGWTLFEKIILNDATECGITKVLILSIKIRRSLFE